MKKNKNKVYNDNLSSYADEMINTIRTIIKQELTNNGLGNTASCQLASAIVNKVNEDGSVDVYFPPNTDSVFTRISNQTCFPLYVGDSVEIMLKNGSFSNCWICAKHTVKSGYKSIQSEFGSENINIEE